MYIESITNRLEYDGEYGGSSSYFESTQVMQSNYSSISFNAWLFHGFEQVIDAGITRGLQDINAGPLYIVVVVQGVKSNSTLAATLIKKPKITNTTATLVSRSEGMNRIEIHGIRFGSDGLNGVGVELSSGFTGQPPLPTGLVRPSLAYTVTDVLVVVELPASTLDALGTLYAVVTRKRGPSDPGTIGTFSNAIMRPVVNASSVERSASASTLRIQGLGFLTVPEDVRVYLQAFNGTNGEHIANVRMANFSATDLIIEGITGLTDPANIGPLLAVVAVRGVKSQPTPVAKIIHIPIILETPSLKISQSTFGNRFAVSGSLFGAANAAMAVELTVNGSVFVHTFVVLTKEDEIIVDALADTSGASGPVTAVVWRSGGPSAPGIIGTITTAIEPPQVQVSRYELCSSVTVLNITAANLGEIPEDVRVYLEATGGSPGLQLATVRHGEHNSRHIVVDVIGISDAQNGPLQAVVTVQSVKAVQQVVAVVHRGSSDIEWKSQARNRFVASTPSTLQMNATFTLSTKDRVALSRLHNNCSFASTAPMLSEGRVLQRMLDANNSITLPDGGGGDSVLEEGDYLLCVCNNDEGVCPSNACHQGVLTRCASKVS